jgi:hypothetical protein
LRKVEISNTSQFLYWRRKQREPAGYTPPHAVGKMTIKEWLNVSRYWCTVSRSL